VRDKPIPKLKKSVRKTEGKAGIDTNVQVTGTDSRRTLGLKEIQR